MCHPWIYHIYDIYSKMRILDSKFVEHQAFSSNWSEGNGGRFTFKNTVPPGYSVHAGMYLNVDVMYN